MDLLSYWFKGSRGEGGGREGGVEEAEKGVKEKFRETWKNGEGNTEEKVKMKVSEDKEGKSKRRIRGVSLSGQVRRRRHRGGRKWWERGRTQ